MCFASGVADLLVEEDRLLEPRFRHIICGLGKSDLAQTCNAMSNASAVTHLRVTQIVTRLQLHKNSGSIIVRPQHFESAQTQRTRFIFIADKALKQLLT